MISRFRSPKQQKEILQKVATGKIDILIGNSPPDFERREVFLTWVCWFVDEEQRFGVRSQGNG